MGLTAKKVYAILKKKIGAMEEQTRHPIRYKGSVNSALELPGNPEIGDMYNISQKSIYGEAGMNVAWNGVVWDTMGASIDMSLYFTKEEADATIQNMVNEYFEKNPVKPGATAEQEQQIDQNKTDIASLKVETNSLKEDLDDFFFKTESVNKFNKLSADKDMYYKNVNGTVTKASATGYVAFLLPAEGGKTYTVSGTSYSVLTVGDNMEYLGYSWASG